jgi:hypothetical protein
MAQQTSVEWLIDKVFDHTLHKDMGQIFTQARKMHKEERMYSEEQVIELIQFLSMSEYFNGYGSVSKETASYFLEKFKKQ